MFHRDIVVHNKPTALQSILLEGHLVAMVVLRFVALEQQPQVEGQGQQPQVDASEQWLQVAGRGFGLLHTLSLQLNHELEHC